MTGPRGRLRGTAGTSPRGDRSRRPPPVRRCVHDRRSGDADPPQRRPLGVVVVIDEQRGPARAFDVGEPRECGGRLRLLVHRRDEAAGVERSRPGSAVRHPSVPRCRDARYAPRRGERGPRRSRRLLRFPAFACLLLLGLLLVLRRSFFLERPAGLLAFRGGLRFRCHRRSVGAPGPGCPFFASRDRSHEVHR